MRGTQIVYIFHKSERKTVTVREYYHYYTALHKFPINLVNLFNWNLFALRNTSLWKIYKSTWDIHIKNTGKLSISDFLFLLPGTGTGNECGTTDLGTLYFYSYANGFVGISPIGWSTMLVVLSVDEVSATVSFDPFGNSS